MATDILKEQYNSLQEENDQYKKFTSEQKDNLVSLERDVTASKSRTQEKLTVPGGRKQEEKHRKHRKRIRVLENKLYQDTIKFDNLLCSNKDCRKDIAHLVQLKGSLCNSEEKSNRHLAKQQNSTDKLEKGRTLVFHQSSEAETRMQKLRECTQVETAQFTKRRMQLKMNIHHDVKLNTFMETKLKEIIPLEEDEDSKRARKKQQQYQTGVKKLEMHMQCHRTIVEVTGERDLHQIGPRFTQNEHKNCTYISNINELHCKRNVLKHGTDTMKSNILFLEQENKGHDEQINSKREDLESESEKYSCLSDSPDKRCAEVQRTLDELTAAISGLLDEIMPEAVIVNLDNVAQFTGILEESINNLLIQANSVELDPQSILLTNSDLLPVLPLTHF
ncbi:uncharacterized protein LOC115008901 [Cottoperca gobio]|uniref:Uncharacterized protein LOC115008901 n=1 Tax=Cottoperca gobio TaxID=56716 RepID=A0A6J2PR58_COTGO|nr:uncharacterized protein LOC115008901 [Cottoperca gobio]